MAFRPIHKIDCVNDLLCCIHFSQFFGFIVKLRADLRKAGLTMELPYMPSKAKLNNLYTISNYYNLNIEYSFFDILYYSIINLRDNNING